MWFEIISFIVAVGLILILMYLRRNRSEQLKKLVNDLVGLIPDVPVYSGTRSYTENKKKVVICTKDQDGKPFDHNTLCFVLLHEIAHVLNKEQGHTAQFYSIFASLLAKAKERGVYDGTFDKRYYASCTDGV